MVSWKQMVLERDGSTVCPTRVMGVVGALLLAGLAGFQIWKGHEVDLMQFALAWSALTVGTAAGARIKLDTEGKPDGISKPDTD